MIPLARVASWPSKIAVSACVACVRLYQIALSPLVGPACRFEPSCSNYMIESLRKYGLIRGACKGIGRVCRCHPWHKGGYDPP